MRLRPWFFLALILLVLVLSSTALAEVPLVDREGDTPQYWDVLPVGYLLKVELVLAYDMYVVGHSTHDTKVRLAWSGGRVDVFTEGDMPPWDPSWHAYAVVVLDDGEHRIHIGDGSRGWGHGEARAWLTARHNCDGTLELLVTTQENGTYKFAVVTNGAMVQVYLDDEANKTAGIVKFSDCSNGGSTTTPRHRIDVPKKPSILDWLKKHRVAVHAALFALFGFGLGLLIVYMAKRGEIRVRA